MIVAPVLALVSLVPAQDAPAGQAVVVHGERGERMDRYLTRLSGLGFSGSVLVEHDGELLLAKGYGMADRERGVPSTTETVMSMGSITKHFTAALILRLEMEGQLSVKDPIGRFFPEVPEDKAGITVHQLLCHTSGLPASADTILGASSRDDFVRRALAVRLVAPPGTQFSYANMGYGLLAAIAETVTGEPYEEALRQLVLDPAGMQRTGFSKELWPSDDLAHGYVNGRDTGTLIEDRNLSHWGIRGSGGLHTCIYDMRLWNKALDEETVLSAEAQAKLAGRHAPMGPSAAYGYGTGVRTTARGTTRLGHNGSNDVFSADYRRYPEDRAMTYVQANDADVYTEDIAPILDTILFGGEVEDPPQVVALTDGALATYAGAWRLESGSVLHVTAEPGRLLIASSDTDAAKLVHPVRPRQRERRDRLLGELEMAFGLAFEGDLEALHRLLDPYSPFDAFSRQYAGRMDSLRSRLGDFESVRTYSGFNRFGEIALVAELGFADGVQAIEYSFGEEEIGSVRFLGGPPARVLRPTSDQHFVSYDASTGDTWGIRFEFDGLETPQALVLFDETGEEHLAER